MTARPRSVGRVVVALNASRQSHAVVTPASRLAHAVDAELVGLFLEDENLLRMASLPFARLIGRTATALPIDPAAMERMLERGRSEAQSALEGAARQHGVRPLFQIVRSPLSEAFGAVVQAGDLIVLERGELGGALSGALARADVSVLCLAASPRPVRSVVIVPEGGEAGSARLEIAAHVAAAAAADLIVVLPSRAAASLARDAVEIAARAGARLQLRVERGRGPEERDRGGEVIAIARSILLGAEDAGDARWLERHLSLLVLC